MEGSGAGAERPQWPSYLRERDPRALVARFLDTDPLRLREAAAARLRETWFLLDPERVYRRTVGVVASAVPCEDPPADLGAWVRGKIDLAVEQLVRRDHEAELDHPEELDEEEMDFALLTESLMLAPELVRRASVGFNALEPLPRRAFFELLIEGRPLADVIEAGPWDADGLYVAVHQALATVGLDITTEPAEDPLRRERKPR